MSDSSEVDDSLRAYHELYGAPASSSFSNVSDNMGTDASELSPLIVKEVCPDLLRNSICISYDEILVITKQKFVEGGALLLAVVAPTTGELIEFWIPKKLCANLDSEKKTLYIWNKALIPKLEEEGFSPEDIKIIKEEHNG